MRAPASASVCIVTFAAGIYLLAQAAGLQFVIRASFVRLLLGEAFGAKPLNVASDILHASAFGFFAPVSFAFIGLEVSMPSVAGLAPRCHPSHGVHVQIFRRLRPHAHGQVP